jgi:hypothetical protein
VVNARPADCALVHARTAAFSIKHMTDDEIERLREMLESELKVLPLW